MSSCRCHAIKKIELFDYWIGKTCYVKGGIYETPSHIPLNRGFIRNRLRINFGNTEVEQNRYAVALK